MSEPFDRVFSRQLPSHTPNWFLVTVFVRSFFPLKVGEIGIFFFFGFFLSFFSVVLL